jgi:purine-binding chemotaxis protein CheW
VDTNTEQKQKPKTETERDLLKQRARELAREPEKEAATADAIEIVAFELSGERYAFELRHVREVCALREITPVPCTPDFIVGVVNLRGEILTVIDLRKFFALPAAGITQLNQIVLIEDSKTRVGILVDAIGRAQFVPVETLQTSLPTLGGIRAEYLRGVTPDQMAVLDAAKILSDGQILIYEEVET